MLLQQEAALEEAVAQGQERERLLLDQHQQVTFSPSSGCHSITVLSVLAFYSWHMVIVLLTLLSIHCTAIVSPLTLHVHAI